jgi:hypothetical protein
MFKASLSYDVQAELRFTVTPDDPRDDTEARGDSFCSLGYAESFAKRRYATNRFGGRSVTIRVSAYNPQTGDELNTTDDRHKPRVKANL